MTHKFDSGIYDLSVCKKLCKYSNFFIVYYLRIWDSSGCLREKRQTFRKSKVLPRGFFKFLVTVAHGVPFSMNKILKNKIRAEELMASSVEAWKVSAVIMFSLFSTYSLVP